MIRTKKYRYSYHCNSTLVFSRKKTLHMLSKGDIVSLSDEEYNMFKGYFTLLPTKTVFADKKEKVEIKEEKPVKEEVEEVIKEEVKEVKKTGKTYYNIPVLKSMSIEELREIIKKENLEPNDESFSGLVMDIFDNNNIFDDAEEKTGFLLEHIKDGSFDFWGKETYINYINLIDPTHKKIKTLREAKKILIKLLEKA